MNAGKKMEPRAKLDMGFDEALARFVQTKPAEVAASIERSKQGKPPDDESGGEARPKRAKLAHGRIRKPRASKT